MNTGSVFIVGSTSSLGQALATLYARQGCALLLAARHSKDQAELAADLRIRYSAKVREVYFDATDSGCLVGIAEAYAQAEPTRIFVLPGMTGDPEKDLSDPAAVQRMTDTNYTSLAAMVAACQAQRPFPKGTRLVFVGSVAGDRGRATNPLYCAAKAALNTYSQALRQRFFRQQVSVTLIRLGYVDSRLSYGLTPPKMTLSPETAARRIARASDRCRSIVYVPGWWWVIMTIMRSVPEFLWKRLPHF